ncbi:hypothetical protein BC629DRAFT_1263928, partial [Irpex lacteus]
HYTSHSFVRFYWKRYVDNGIVGLSPVYDYMCRPEKYDNVTLYDWIRQSRKMKLSQKETKPILDEQDSYSDIDSVSERDNNSDEESISDQVISETDYDSDEENTSDQESSNDANQSNNDNDKSGDYHSFAFFTKQHPQYDKYKVKLTEEHYASVPDFIGGMLPRQDKGNREDYCMTMLTFFKPWRTGLELKDIGTSWSDAFDSHTFTEHQLQVMKFFHIRYECKDSRDDYAAQRK